jgi:D-glycerate 3-kinase
MGASSSPHWPERSSPAKAEHAAQVLSRARPEIEAWFAREGLGDSLRDLLQPLYVPLALWLAARRERQERPLIAGIAGAQGSGKSSIAALLALLLEHGLGLRPATLSLDDLYLTRKERARLAREVHPLHQTRGLPGSHDVQLGLEALAALCGAAPGELVRVPRFDKARDDRMPETKWASWRGPIDIVLFEGWCLCAEPEPAAKLVTPLNAFEREQDSDARFRRYVDAQLAGSYRALFERIDAVVFLAVPDMTSVRRWRAQQEHKLEARAAEGPALMGEAELEQFVQRFERITRRMSARMPARADVVLRLGQDHRCAAVELRRHRSHRSTRRRARVRRTMARDG